MFHMIQIGERRGNWQHREQLKLNVVFRRQIIAGKKSSRKGVLIQLKRKVLKDLTAASVAVKSCAKLYLYRLVPEGFCFKDD